MSHQGYRHQVITRENNTLSTTYHNLRQDALGKMDRYYVSNSLRGVSGTIAPPQTADPMHQLAQTVHHHRSYLSNDRIRLCPRAVELPSDELIGLYQVVDTMHQLADTNSASLIDEHVNGADTMRSSTLLYCRIGSIWWYN